MKKFENTLFWIAVALILAGILIPSKLSLLLGFGLLTVLGLAGLMNQFMGLDKNSPEKNQSKAVIVPVLPYEDLENEIDQNSPWAVGLWEEVSYKEYLQARDALLAYFRKIKKNPNLVIAVEDKVLPVADLEDEVYSQTTLGKNYVQRYILDN